MDLAKGNLLEESQEGRKILKDTMYVGKPEVDDDAVACPQMRDSSRIPSSRVLHLPYGSTIPSTR